MPRRVPGWKRFPSILSRHRRRWLVSFRNGLRPGHCRQESSLRQRQVLGELLLAVNLMKCYSCYGLISNVRFQEFGEDDTPLFESKFIFPNIRRRRSLDVGNRTVIAAVDSSAIHRVIEALSQGNLDSFNSHCQLIYPISRNAFPQQDPPRVRNQQPSL